MSGWLTGFLIAVGPLLLLVVLLAHGRYPGEKTLHRLRRAVTLMFTPAISGPDFLFVSVPAFRLRGGRLLAERLAGRGPPAS